MSNNQRIFLIWSGLRQKYIRDWKMKENLYNLCFVHDLQVNKGLCSLIYKNSTFCQNCAHNSSLAVNSKEGGV